MFLQATKRRARESFNRAASSYDGAAELQRLVCEQMLSGLACNPEPDHVLDAGCGTGFGSRLLRTRWPTMRITAIDFAPAMVETTRAYADTCCVADIEVLPFENASFDLWWSNLTIQWCESKAVFGEARRVLKPNGRLAVSTLAPDTFHELREAFSTIDAYRHTLTFNSPEETVDAIARAGFQNVTMQKSLFTMYYPDLKTLCRSIKAVGANTIDTGTRTGLMGRSTWQKLEKSYESQRTEAGLPISYEAILCYAQA